MTAHLCFITVAIMASVEWTLKFCVRCCPVPAVFPFPPLGCPAGLGTENGGATFNV